MHKAGDVVFMIVIVALAFVIVRPGSQAAAVVRSLGEAFAGAIQSATGQVQHRGPRPGARHR